MQNKVLVWIRSNWNSSTLECTWEQLFWKTVQQYLLNLNPHVSYDTAIVLLNFMQWVYASKGMHKNAHISVVNISIVEAIQIQ